MFLMLIIMSLPLLGIGLFFVMPFGAALAVYLGALGFFALNQCLMMRAMRLPVCTGTEKLAGSLAVVLNWQGEAGQVIREGEIWRAEAKDRLSFARGQKVAINKITGLTLWVRPVED
jgi:membrane-bound ClpP family serine protease